MRALLAVSLIACASLPHVERRASVGHVEAAARNESFDRALQLLQRDGWAIAVSDRDAGTLTTQRKDTGVKPCGRVTCPSRSTLQIRIDAAGVVTVDLQREFLLTLNGSWFPPGVEQDVRPIEAEQEQILAAITAR